MSARWIKIGLVFFVAAIGVGGILVTAVEITSRVQCADYFPVRDEALLAHATQIDPESSWFACPVEVQRAAWPTEDYHLARSVVDTDFPEDDLFAGVRERVSR